MVAISIRLDDEKQKTAWHPYDSMKEDDLKELINVNMTKNVLVYRAYEFFYIYIWI